MAKIYYSDDDGRSFKKAVDDVHSPYNDNSGLKEPGIYELADVRLWLYARKKLCRDFSKLPPKAFDIIQLADNALQIADAVAVAVEIALGIDLVKYCGFQPACCHVKPPFLPRGRVFP